MAEIDLKQVSMYIEDGRALTLAVNNSGGYAANAVTMLVDGIVGALVVGDVFYEVDGTSHTITAHSETGGNTTSVTFTPGLVTLVTDNQVLAVGPHRIELKIGDGNLTYSEKRNRIYRLEKQRLDGVKDGPDEPMDLNIDLIWEYLKSDTGFPISPREAITGTGAASTWTSAGAACEPYAVNIRLAYDPLCTAEKTEVNLFEQFRYEEIGGDVKAGTLAVKGKCNKTTPTSTRVP